MNINYSTNLVETTHTIGEFEVCANAYQMGNDAWHGFASIFQGGREVFREVVSASSPCLDSTPYTAIRRVLSELRWTLKHESVWFVYEFQREQCIELTREATKLVKDAIKA